MRYKVAAEHAFLHACSNEAYAPQFSDLGDFLDSSVQPLLMWLLEGIEILSLKDKLLDLQAKRSLLSAWREWLNDDPMVNSMPHVWIPLCFFDPTLVSNDWLHSFDRCGIERLMRRFPLREEGKLGCVYSAEFYRLSSMDSPDSMDWVLLEYGDHWESLFAALGSVNQVCDWITNTNWSYEQIDRAFYRHSATITELQSHERLLDAVYKNGGKLAKKNSHPKSVSSSEILINT